MSDLDDRLARIILTRREFTADDITAGGAIAVDPSHTPNSRQSSIGSHFRTWKQQGYIEQTGRMQPSVAPKRKGGMIQIWRSTDRGIRWAMTRKETKT